MPNEIDDIATRYRVLLTRIHRDERALAIAYPQDAKRLSEDLERQRALLADLEREVEEAKEEVRRQLRSAVDTYFEARGRLLSLNGHIQDPGLDDPIFSSVAYGSGPQPMAAVQSALLQAAEIKPARRPEIPTVQRQHEERVRNERAGLGHYTDTDLARRAANPDLFEYGAGYKRIKPMRVPGGDNV